MINVFENELLKNAKKFGNLVLLTPDDCFCGEFLRFFADRSFIVGFGEQNMMAMSAGFCVRNKLPVLFAPALAVEKAFVQIKNCICQPNLNVKIVAYGEGELCDLLVKSLPNISIYLPEDEIALAEILPEFLSTYGPGYLRLR